jgi:diguanylate cyclase (GGDEF)-like protein
MPDIAKRLEKADKYLQKGKPEAALEEYLAALDEDPRNDGVRQKAADLCVTLNRTAEAFQLLVEMFKQEAAVGDAARAVNTYRRMARVGKPEVEQTLQYAQLCEKSNRKDAIEAYEGLQQQFSAANKAPDELNVLRRLIALDPTIPRLTREGELAEKQGDPKEAAQAFVRAGELQIASVEAIARTGQMQDSGRQESLHLFERAHQLDSQNAEAALACGRAYMEDKRHQDALNVTEPFATRPDASDDFRDVYARALVALGRPLDAETHITDLYKKDPARNEDMALLIGALLDADQGHKATLYARQLEEHEYKRGRRREYVARLKEVLDDHAPRIEFLEYLVEAFNSNNREQDYCATLNRLFDLYYAAGQFIKAGDALDRAAEVDPYEDGHRKRLDLLRGKIDNNRFNTIANRIGSVSQAGAPALAEAQPAAAPGSSSETTVLEDLVLQAEIFLQYSMRSRAVERLERIAKLFPHEEDRNEKLRTIYQNAGFMPKYDDAVAAAPASKSGSMPAAIAAPVAMAPSQMMSEESAVDNFSRVTEITRNIYRQGTVKGVLFTAVNDIGRHWNASRCVAGMCTPGKPPSAALEYCSPGTKQSDVMAIVKLIASLQHVALERGFVTVEDVKQAPELRPIAPMLEQLNVDSLLAVPLLDGDEPAGILILEQCGAPRKWRQTDVVMLRTIADQMTVAVNNARLRSLMKTLAVTDEKSGLLKRSSYIDVLLSETRRSMQQNSPMSLMLMQFGTGPTMRDLSDTVVESLMQQLGQTICSHVRQNDVAVRYDRHVIAVILSDTNDKNSFFVVDKLRKLLVSTHMPGQDLPIPTTIGIAEAVLNPEYDAVDIVTELINRAEGALESAKTAGIGQAKSLAPVLESAAVA